MAMRGLSLVLLLGMLVLPPAASAQNYGDGFGIGGVLIPDEGSLMILGTTRLGESLALELGVGMDLFDNDNTSETDVDVILGARKYWNTEGAFQPFYGGRVSLSHSAWDRAHSEGDDTAFGLSAILGGEYFLSRRVSVEGEVGAGMFFGSFRFATGTRLAAFMYL